MEPKTIGSVRILIPKRIGIRDGHFSRHYHDSNKYSDQHFFGAPAGANVSFDSPSPSVLVGSYFRVASPSLTLAYWMGSAAGPGILLAAFGASAMGRAGRETHENS
jgi:hypothetical protein